MGTAESEGQPPRGVKRNLLSQTALVAILLAIFLTLHPEPGIAAGDTVATPGANASSGVEGRSGLPTFYCYGTKGPHDSGTECVKAFAANGSFVASAYCSPTGVFSLALAPGRYWLEFESNVGTRVEHETRMVEIKAGQWVKVYALGATPGPVPIRPCPRLQ